MARGLGTWSTDLVSERMPVNAGFDLPALFHRLNNQLGIVLANAELLEAQIADPMQRARASQVVASTLEAMATARDLRTAIDHGVPADPADLG